ncbi:DUF72 domain-containing protein [Nocardioides halotolerans]|uniref:DUF72 domain-containing protein n=1 Tax=Nocardioides halotolerans TaxID=433660 RepID=UPI00040D2566|nr:DUF72 domain-containing protein [Nocardioides halotolerans]
MAELRIGISGWSYRGWRGDFYPKGLPQRRELEYAAERLTSIEINGSFYSLQKPTSYQKWRAETPDDFVFAVKGSRFISHMKRMTDAEEPLKRFFDSGVFELGPKLGPILWQLPESFRYDGDRLAAFFDILPRTTPDGRELRYALEFRSKTFEQPEAYALLREHRIATVLADTAGRWPKVEEDTADFRYVRLHGDAELYTSGYDDASLRRWADTIRRWGQDTYVYFDNDAKGYAPHDAERLIELLACD